MHDRCLTINTPVYLCSLFNKLVEPHTNIFCAVRREDKTLRVYKQIPNTPYIDELISVKYELDTKTGRYKICF